MAAQKMPPHIKLLEDRFRNMGNRWRKFVLTSPDNLHPQYRGFYWHPFGIWEWNRERHIYRSYLAEIGKYEYSPCPYCGPDDGCPAQDTDFSVFRASLLEILHGDMPVDNALSYFRCNYTPQAAAYEYKQKRSQQ